MKRVALISDQHFDTSSRWEETLRIADFIVEDLAGRDVDAIALGGDLFERRPNPQETKAVAEWIVRLANIAPVVGVYGNHDVKDSLAELPLLEANYPIEIFDRPAVYVAGGVAFACLPWPRKAHLLAQLGPVGPEAVAQAAAGAMQNVLRGLGQTLDGHSKEPRLFLGHVSLRGSRVSTGQPMIGLDLELGLEDLSLVRAQAYLLGHIHMGQQFDIAGAPAIYPGSIRRTQFGELEEKAYVLVTLGAKGRVDVERVPTPATPMVHLEMMWARNGMLILDCGRQPHENEFAALATGAEVRLRYDVDADQREAARAGVAETAELIRELGAVSVKIEEVVRTETRARVPEIASAITLQDKLATLWEAKAFEPGERLGPLLSKLELLETEVRDAA